MKMATITATQSRINKPNPLIINILKHKKTTAVAMVSFNKLQNNYQLV